MSLIYGFGLGEPGTEYTSAQFSEAFRQITGNGVCMMGGKLALSISGFIANLSTGYALTAGRWVENDEPLLLVLPPSSNHEDRTDAIAVHIDEEERKAALEILSGVDPAAPPDGALYLIRVKRGATSLTEDNVTDLRRDILPLSELTAGALRVYRFLTSGIDQEVERILALSKAVAGKADAAVAALDAAIQQAGGGPGIGELVTARSDPGPGWLLCNGDPVPDGYPALAAAVGGTLPDLSRTGDRYQTYIYGGLPEE